MLLTKKHLAGEIPSDISMSSPVTPVESPRSLLFVESPAVSARLNDNVYGVGLSKSFPRFGEIQFYTLFFGFYQMLQEHSPEFPSSQWISHTGKSRKKIRVIDAARGAWMAGSVGEVLQRDPRGRICPGTGSTWITLHRRAHKILMKQTYNIYIYI